MPSISILHTFFILFVWVFLASLSDSILALMAFLNVLWLVYIPHAQYKIERDNRTTTATITSTATTTIKAYTFAVQMRANEKQIQRNHVKEADESNTIRKQTECIKEPFFFLSSVFLVVFLFSFHFSSSF